jgi:hypothetical protein
MAYYSVLGQPGQYELLEHLDPQVLQKTVAGLRLTATTPRDPENLISELSGRFPSSAPGPLWLAWMQIVNEEKVKRESVSTGNTPLNSPPKP